jgi:alkylated DNA repair dioxygenase AlkB
MNAPGIYLNPALIAAPELLLAWLKTGVTWDERMKARKTASFGASYNYSQIAYAPTPMPAELEGICTLLAAELGFRPNNCLVNFYPDGDSSMGFHSDSTEGLAPGTGVAIVSVGSVRSIVFRNKQDRTCEFAYPLPSGSLLYMSELIQHDWLHAIPKAPGAAQRISLTFRSILA